MALEKDTNLKNGLAVPGAYHRINAVEGNKNYLTITVVAYVSKEAYEEGCDYLAAESYGFIPSVADDAPNFIKQGYEHLKTLAEFESAVYA